MLIVLIILLLQLLQLLNMTAKRWRQRWWWSMNHHQSNFKYVFKTADGGEPANMTCIQFSISVNAVLVFQINALLFFLLAWVFKSANFYFIFFWHGQANLTRTKDIFVLHININRLVIGSVYFSWYLVFPAKPVKIFIVYEE